MRIYWALNHRFIYKKKKKIVAAQFPFVQNILSALQVSHKTRQLHETTFTDIKRSDHNDKLHAKIIHLWLRFFFVLLFIVIHFNWTLKFFVHFTWKKSFEFYHLPFYCCISRIFFFLLLFSYLNRFGNCLFIGIFFFLSSVLLLWFPLTKNQNQHMKN